MSESLPNPKPLIEYPIVYAFKVMGRVEDDFGAYVRQKFSMVLGIELGNEAISENTSAQGKYVSLTVSVYLQSEEQRQSIYTQLHVDKRIVYYL